MTLIVEYVSPSSLKPFEGNPRTISASAFNRLRQSIRTFGLVDPLIARRSDCRVIGGHQRLAAAEAEGLETVPVVFVDVTDEEADALTVLLNNPAAQGTWDEDKLTDLLRSLPDATLAGFEAGEVEQLLEAFNVESVRIDDAFGAVPSGDKPPFEQITFTVHTEQAELIREALRAAKAAGPFVDTGNENSNGNALARIAEAYAAVR